VIGKPTAAPITVGRASVPASNRTERVYRTGGHGGPLYGVRTRRSDVASGASGG
jgi:hypothetical protein